ncbi:MAG: hypothetical protein FJY07_07570, partial [Bacteroidetes bacterium]|nr:hypothetical protein [Bacteroidota bacterium]
MKNFYLKFNLSQFVTVWVIPFMILANSVFAGITVTSSGGTPSANYTYLYQAFNAINTGTHSGIIRIAVSGSINDGTTSAILNASGSGGANYTSLTIYPTAAATIYANIQTGSVIDLNGADNVVIDGRIDQTGSIQSLTIRNTNTASSNYQAKTLYLHGDACYNQITYCIIEGSSSYVWGDTDGTIYFGVGIEIGNDNNIIEYCNIKKYSNKWALRSP